MKTRILAIIGAIVLQSALSAHGGAEHIIGFVRAVSSASLTVETPKHEAVVILVTPKTQAMKGKIKAGVTDLKPGDRVVIHAMKNKDGKLEASEAEFAAAPVTATKK